MMCRRSESLLCPAGLFFFSSRRRHTRLQGDWSSDVCSSDLADPAGPFGNRAARVRAADARSAGLEAPPGSSGEAGSRSEERRVGKSVDLGGRRIIKKKKDRREKAQAT